VLGRARPTFDRRKKIGAALTIVLCFAVTAAAQRGRRRVIGGAFAASEANGPYDGAFRFCRIMFRQNPYGDGNGWSVDYPRADINLSYRLSELTTTAVSRTSRGDYNHAVFQLTDAELYKCPFIMMTEPGGSYFDDEEATHLRDYLLRGGFLWADDFWGEVAWDNWSQQIRKALPEYQTIDIPLGHPLFHMLYQVHQVPQIPSIDFWAGAGNTSERGAESAIPHARGIFDEHGRMIVLITFNTDFGDAFEREGDNHAYFEQFAGPGYAFGINALLYAMTH
jgi:Domain of unknown function (DUF4159)